LQLELNITNSSVGDGATPKEHGLRLLEDAAAGGIAEKMEERFGQGMGNVELNMVFVPLSNNTEKQK